MPTAFRVLSVRFSFLFKFPGFRSLILALMLGMPGVALADLTSVPSVVYADGATESFRIEWYCNADECNVLEQQGTTWVSLKNTPPGTNGLYLFRPIGTHSYRLEECWYHYSGEYITYCSRRSPRTVEIKKAIPAVPTITAPSADSDGKYTVEVRGDLSVTSFRVWQTQDEIWFDLLPEESAQELSVPTPSSSSSYKYVRLNLNNSNGSYEYRAKACNNAGCSGYSSSRTVDVHIAPGTPPSISVPSLTDGTFTVNWGAASGETSNYELYRRTGSGSWQIVYNNKSRSTVESVPEGTYTYRVRACYHGKCSPYRTSNTTAAAVPVRTNLNYLPSTNTTGSYTVKWGNVDNRDGFELQERKGSGSWKQVSGVSGTSHSFSNNSGTYSYRVRACNALGCADSWSPVKTIDVAVRPSTPSSISVPTSPTDGSFNVSWNFVSGVTRYELERRIGTGSWTNVHGSSHRNYSESGVGQGSYRYRVRACRIVGSAYGCSSWRTSGTVTVAPPASPPTLALPATNGTGDYQFSWTHVGNTTRYVLQENAGNGWVRQNLPTDQTRSFSYTGKGNGTYTYRVRACNAIGCSGFSQTATIDIALRPGVPAVITVPEAAGSTFNISWSTGSGSVTTYKLERQSGGESELIYAQATPHHFTETGLTAGTYTYRVRACRATRSFENCSGWRTSDAVTVVAKPNMPKEGFSALPGENGGVALDWSEVASQITADISYFILEYNIDRGEWVSPYIYKGTDTSFTLPYIAEGEHQFSLRACILVETTEPFELCSDRNLEPPPVAKPSDPPTWDDGLPTSSTDGYYQLSWTHTGDTSWYVVQESFNGGEWTEVATPTEQYHAFENQRSGRYRYRLQACNGFGCSEDTSAEHIVDVALEPDVPTWQSSVTYSDGNHEVVWNDLLDNVTHYVLQTSSDNGTSWAEVSNSAALSHAFSDLPAGTYQYRVAAHNNVGEVSNQSDWSEVYSVTVAIPQVPSNVRVIDLVQNNFSVVWDSVDNVREYEIQEIIGVVLNTWRVDANTLGVYLADKAENTYAYRIRACNAVGCSEASAPAGVSVAITPGRPGSLTAVAGFQTGLTELFWDTAAGAPDVYEVQQRIGSSGYGASVSFTGLSGIWPEAISQAGIYQYRVRACRSVGSHVGCSGWRSSNVIEYSIPGVPVLHGPEFAPDGIYVVSWIFEGEATEFILEENGVEQHLLTSSVTFSEENPRPEGIYTYRVKACNLLDCSEYSLPLTVTAGVVEDPEEGGDGGDDGGDNGEGEGGVGGEGGSSDDGFLVESYPPSGPAPGEQVGAIEGHFRVNEAGAATYSIPLSLPKGTAGVTPQLGLAYSSQGGNGPLGQGWALEGLSSISRCRQTLSQDGQARPITWSEEDRFCLDGQRLILDTGAGYGAVGATYKTELDSFVTVTAHGGTAGHPEYFTVSAKDGSTSTYGGTAASRAGAGGTNTLSWMRSRFADNVGNRIDFNYTGDADSGHRIQRVDYAYTATDSSSNPRASVEFLYEERPDASSSYVMGYRFSQTRRLRQILVFNGNSTALQEYRRYDLVYQHDSVIPIDSTSRLESIEECVVARCLRKTTFTWPNPTALGDDQQVTANTNGGTLVLGDIPKVYTFRHLDINGDGKLDLAWIRYRNNNPDHQELKYALAGDDGRYHTSRLALNGIFDTDLTSSNNNLEMHVIDYNADGRQDIIVRQSDAEEGYVWRLFLSVATGESWDLREELYIEFPFANTKVQFGDINSDGMADAYYLHDNRLRVHYLEKQEGGLTSNRLHYRYRQNFKSLPIEGFETHFDDDYWEVFRPVSMGDFNGDGRVDLVVTAEYYTIENYTGAPEPGPVGHGTQYFVLTSGDGQLDVFAEVGPDGDRFTTGFLPATDLNGDGLTDLIFRKNEAWQMSLSTGDGLTQAEIINSIPGWTDEPLLADINRDGYPDLIRVSGGLQAYAWLPAENRFSNVATQFASGVYGRDGYHTAVIDIDGDGWNDVVTFRDGNSEWVEQSSWSNLLADNRGETSPNLITEIENGLGNKIEIDYQVLTGSNHYSRVDVDRVTTTALEEVCVPYPRGPNSDNEVCYKPVKHSVSTTDFYRSLNDPFSTLPEGNDHLEQAASPVLELYAPMPVVTSVASSSPTAEDTNAMARVSYFYDQMKFQAAGRGSLGFRKLTTVDHQTATVTETTYRQDWPFIGSPLETVVKTADGHLLSHAVNRWGLKTFPAEDGTVRYQPYIRESVEEGYDLEDNGGSQGPLLKTVTTTNDYDDYGNPEIITTVTEGNSESISKTVVNEYGDDWNRRFGRLTGTTVTTTRGSETDTRRSEFDYIQSGAKKGLLVREIVEPGTAHELTTTYTYDNYGNKTHAVQQAADGTSRQSDTTVYDAGRYVRTVTNALDHVTEEVLSRNRFGAPTRVRNINGVESTITYDDMGAEYLREDDTGAWAWTGRRYCDSGIACPSVAEYRVEERVAGGGISYTYHDLLGREVRRSSVSFDGTLVNVDTEYDNLGRASRVSNPYFNGSSPTGWTKSEYDILGRVVSIELPDGTPGGTTVYDGYSTIITNAKSHTKTEIRDLAGNLTRVIDNLGGTVDYDYDLGGNLLSATTDAPDANPVTVRMCYDKLGRKIAMHDPDKGGFLGNAGATCETVAHSNNMAGWWYYRHNGLGDLVSQTDTKGQTQSMTYDALGRMITRTDRRGNGSVEGYTRWYYDGDDNGSSFPGDLGNLTQVVQSSNGISTSCSGNNLCTSHIYDDYGRLSDTITLRPGASESYTTGVRYDSIGRPYRHHDALHGLVMDESGTRQHYNEYGYKSEVTDLATGERLHKINAVDARGQVLQEERGNGAVTDYEYDPYFGRLIHQHASTTSWLPIQDIGYDWDVLGNLNWRHNRSVNQGNTSQKDLRENFCYDGLNRLINSQQGSLSGACGAGQDVEYDGLGNITFKAGVGVYEYGANAGPHAVTLAGNISYTYDNNGNMTGGDGRTLTYSTFDKPVEISKGNHTTRFSYGPERGRYQRVDIKNGVATTTRYLGSVERIHKQGDGTVTWRRTVAGAIYTVTTDLNNVIQGETDKAFVYKDHLGSTDVITDAVGTVIESQSFDAWGQRRNSEDWNALTTSQLLGFNSTRTERGYTGHEQMDETGLIHMNGRVYDAKLARFLQADPFIQAASNTQSYNRYSYVWNNPLNATDPSGFFLKRLLDEYHRSAPGGRVLNHVAGSPRLSMVVSIALNFIPGCQGWCGIAVQAGFRAGTTYASTGSLRTAAISGAISFGSSAAFMAIGASGSDGFGGHVGKSLAHGIVGGAVSLAQGGNFGHGFASAGLTNFLNVNAMFGAAGMGGTEYEFARLVTAAIIGGTISERTGGKFANGALTATFQFVAASAASQQNEINCSSPCNGEVEVNFSQLKSPADYKLASDHLRSLVGDDYVNQDSLNTARLNVSFAGAHSNSLHISKADDVQIVFNARYLKSQSDISKLVGGLMAIPFVASSPIASLKTYGYWSLGNGAYNLIDKPGGMTGTKFGIGLSREILTIGAGNHPAAVVINTAVSAAVDALPNE